MNNKCKLLNINYEIIRVDEKFNLGYCLNKAIDLLKIQKYQIFSKFDDDDIYGPKYLLEQIKYLNKYSPAIIGKHSVPIFIPERNSFYSVENLTKTNQFTTTCYGSTITFQIDCIPNTKFSIDKKQNIVSTFLKDFTTNGGKVYSTSFNNYIWIRYLAKTNIDNSKLKLINNNMKVYNLYSNLINHKFIHIDHLLVTIIITMYNCSRTIIECLNSMINQTHKNIKIIIVDDNSDDNSISIVNEFIKKYNNIKLIKNKFNRGTYYCKNLALNQMNKNTDYIAFQDSDDYSHKERIRKQVEILELNNGKVSMSLCKRYNTLRLACISKIISIEVFKKLGYFDNNRFGADSLYLNNYFMSYHKTKLLGNFNFDNSNEKKTWLNYPSLNKFYLIPFQLYYINLNSDTNLTNIIPLDGPLRRFYIKYFKQLKLPKYFKKDEILFGHNSINYTDNLTLTKFTNNKIIINNSSNFSFISTMILTIKLNNNTNIIDINIFDVFDQKSYYFENTFVKINNNIIESYIFIDNPNENSKIIINCKKKSNIKTIILKKVDYKYYINNLQPNKILYNNHPIQDTLKFDFQSKKVRFQEINYKINKLPSNDDYKHILTKISYITLPQLPKLTLPLVSVIMTCYNSENTVEYSIKSILNQSYSNIELIIVDDYSSDNTKIIINKFKNIDNIIIINNKTNMKTYKSRNIALEKSSGEIITFIDSDDISTYDRITKQVSNMLQYNSYINITYGVRVTDLNILKHNYNKLSLYDRCIKSNNNKINIEKKSMLPFQYRPHLALVTSCIRKEVFDKIGDFKEIPCSGDKEFLERFIAYFYNVIFYEKLNLYTLLNSYCSNIGDSLHVINEVLYVSLLHNNNLTTKYNVDFRNKLKNDYKNNFIKKYNIKM